MESFNHIRDTQERIVACFKKLVMEKGFEKVRIREITDLAGLTRPTFYLYFKDKYEVAEYIFMTEVGEAVRPWLELGYNREAFMQFIIRLNENRQFYRELAKVEGQNSPGQLIRNFAVDAISKYMSKYGRIVQDGLYNVEMMSNYFGEFLQFVIIQYLRKDMVYSIDELLHAYDLLMNHSPRQLLEGNVGREE